MDQLARLEPKPREGTDLHDKGHSALYLKVCPGTQLYVTILAVTMADPDKITTYISIEGDNPEHRLELLGVAAREIGGIAVTLVDGLDAEWFSLSPAELETQRRLDTNIADPVRDLGPSRQIESLLTRIAPKGIVTIRDVLVYGNTLQSGRVGLTKAQFTLVETAVSNVCPEYPLLDKPTPEYIARFPAAFVIA